VRAAIGYAGKGSACRRIEDFVLRSAQHARHCRSMKFRSFSKSVRLSANGPATILLDE